MSRWFKQILYFLCILEISSANPTRAPDIIKGEEEVKFQNKLPEDPLDSENTLVGKPLNTTNHRIGPLGNDQSTFRENEKHHCPFCQYAANTQGSIENPDQDSESTQAHLIIGSIKAVAGETNIITEQDAPNDNNSTWNPQNEIKAILKIPDGSPPNNGKEYKRCTHSDNTLGGSLQKTEQDNNLLNNPDVLNNIDFSCCSTLRRIVLHALKLEGKCLCSEHRATSPIINITALNDSEFEKGIIRQEFPSIFIRQQQNTPSKILNQDNEAGNTLLEQDTKTTRHNKENDEINTPGMKSIKYNITSFGSGRQDLKENSDGSEVTLISIVNTSLITDEKIKEPNANDKSDIDETPIIQSGNQVETLVENDGLITQSKTQTEPSSESKKEYVLSDTTNEFSTIRTAGPVVPSISTGENSVVSSTVPNKKLEQIDEYPRKPATKVNYMSTDNSINRTLGLYVDQGIENNILNEELDGDHGNEEKMHNSNGVANDYTTESELILIVSEKPNSTTIADKLLKMNMQFSEGITESIQESTQNMETQTLEPRSADDDLYITYEKKASHTDGDLLKIPMIDHDLLQSKAETQSVEKEKLKVGREKMFLKSAENQSSTAMFEDRNNFPTTIHTEDWPEVNSMSTTAYDIGQHIEIDDTLLEEGQPKHNTENPIILTTGPSITSTNAPEMSKEPSEENENILKDQIKDFQKIFNNSHSLNEGSEPSKMQDESGNLLAEFHGTESTAQQTQSTGTLVGNQIPNHNRENSSEISTKYPSEDSTHLVSLPRLNSFKDFTPSFEVNLLTTESTLQETKNSTRSYEGNSLTTESISQETKSTGVIMGNEVPDLSSENTPNISSSDFLASHQQLSSQEYLLGTESPHSTDSLLEDETSNLTTGKPSDIKFSDPRENNQQLLLGQTENINHQSHNGQDILDRLEPDNYILGSIQIGLAEKQPTNIHLEGEILNLTTGSPSEIKLSDPVRNNQPEGTEKIDHQSQNNQDNRFEPDSYMLGSIQTESTQTQLTDSFLEGNIFNLTTGKPSDIKLNNPIEKNQQEETEKIDNWSKNEQDIISGDLEPDNYTLVPHGVESGTLPNDLVSPLASDYLDMNIETVATTPHEANFLSQFNGDITSQKQLSMSSSTETITSELLLATDKIYVNEVPHEENSTGIDLEMAKAEDILKSLIAGFKKTHLEETYDNKEATDNPEMALMDASTYGSILKNINELKSSDKHKDSNEDPINIETYTDNSKNIEQYPKNVGFNSPNNDVNLILQNAKISSESTGEDLLESTTMTINNKTKTTMSSDNITGIQHSSEMNKTLSRRVNLVDYDKYLADINELHIFSADNESTLIESLEGSGSSSTLPPDFNSQITDTKDRNEESTLSMIDLFSPRLFDDELTLVSHNTGLTPTESELVRASDKDVRQNPQEISNPNFVTLIPKEVETATSNAINQEDESYLSSNYPGKTTKISVWNNVAPEISDTSSSLGQSSLSKAEPPVNKLNSTDLEEEILSTGNYLVHHVNVSKYEDSGNINNNVQETSKPNLNSDNMTLEEFETTTMITEHQKESDDGFSYLTSNLSEDSKLIESTTITLTNSDNENTDLAQILTPTEISEFEMHSPVIVCLPEEDSNQLNNDLLGSRFFIQNDANVIEFKLVQRNVSLCGCPHNSYELRPKSRVSKADMNVLKSLQGQHITKILRRAHIITDKTTDNFETTTGYDKMLNTFLDSDKKMINISRITSDKSETNEDSGNQALGSEHVKDYRDFDNFKEKHSCNCQCLGNVNPSILENRKESQNPSGMDIDRGLERTLKSQIKNSESGNITRLDKENSYYKEGINYKSKYNRGRQQSSRRRDFPIMVDKDILKRFISVYRPHNYLRRS